jgi:voltage-gated potassium channel
MKINRLTENLMLMACYVDISDPYQNAKAFFRKLLDDKNYKYNKLFEWVMFGMIVASVGIYLHDVKSSGDGRAEFYEILFSIIFGVEYLLRLWIYSDAHKIAVKSYEEATELGAFPSLKKVALAALKDRVIFVLKPMSIIDFLSIFPLLGPIRIFKVFRYIEATNDFFSIFTTKRYELFILGGLICLAILMAAVLMYVFEPTNPNIKTFFDSIYWAVITIATVGYGDIAPLTLEGRILTIGLVFSGLGVIAMLTSIITNGLAQKLEVVKERKNVEFIEKMKEFVLVAGYGSMGEELADKFASDNIELVIMDQDPAKVQKAQAKGYHAILGNATSITALESIGVNKKAKAVICLTHSDMVNLSIILAVRATKSKTTMIARAKDRKNENKLLSAGASHVVSNEFGAVALADFVNHPIAYQAIAELLFDDTNIIADEVIIPALTSVAHELDLDELDVDGLGCILLAVCKEQEGGRLYFNKSSDGLKLRGGDTLIVIGTNKKLDSLRHQIEKRIFGL